MTSRVHFLKIFLKRPGFGEELIMIAFWESELEDREVFYHSITGEDTGEGVFQVIHVYGCLLNGI